MGPTKPPPHPQFGPCWSAVFSSVPALTLPGCRAITRGYRCRGWPPGAPWATYLYPAANRVDRETALSMYTVAGAQLSGEGDKKGRIKVGQYGDLAILSADFFAVADEDISRIESLLTVAGGRVVYAAGEYEDIAVPLDDITLAWSPIARFGGYQAEPLGVRQARDLLEVAVDSEDQRAWRDLHGASDSTVESPHDNHDLLHECF